MNDNVAAASSRASGNRVSRTPHVVTMAVTYRCQCRCGHCSASTWREFWDRLRAEFPAATG